MKYEKLKALENERLVDTWEILNTMEALEILCGQKWWTASPG